MKYSCNIVRDLIPLFIDGVCSKESTGMVEEHLEECEDCRRLCRELQEPLHTEEKEQFRKEQEASLKKIQTKWKRTKRLLIGIGVLLGGAITYVMIRFVIPIFIAIGGLVFSGMLAKPKVVEDVGQYESCIGPHSDDEYGTLRQSQFDVFPVKVEDETVEDFKYVYYNPFDPQYVAYLTVKYDEQAYQTEMERLRQKGVFSRYREFYSVTGEPEGYDLVAMDADSYSGFCYAMIPEREDGTITYVGIVFCNYFLDLDIHDFVPGEYLPEGFDASEDNPYMRMKMHR